MTAQAEGPASARGPLVCSVEEAAELLGVGRTFVFRLIARGEIDSFKIGSRRKIPRAAIDSYIERRLADQSDEPDHHPRLTPNLQGGRQRNQPHSSKP